MKTYSTNYVDVFYNPKLQAVEVVWKGFASTENYKKALNEAFDIIVESKCQRWASNMQDGKAVSLEASQWLKEEFVPKALKQGINKVAFLLESNVFREMFADSIKSTIMLTGAELKYFENRAELEKWMIQ